MYLGPHSYRLPNMQRIEQFWRNFLDQTARIVYTGNSNLHSTRTDPPADTDSQNHLVFLAWFYLIFDLYFQPNTILDYSTNDQANSFILNRVMNFGAFEFQLACLTCTVEKNSNSRTLHLILMKFRVNVPRTLFLLSAKYAADWTI